MRVHYNEEFNGITFSEINYKNYVQCTFNNCIFKDGGDMSFQVMKLLETDNKLVGCWFNPVLALTKIFDALSSDVNLIDAINKSMARNKVGKNGSQKQLVLIDID